jgi:hypothetical protein
MVPISVRLVVASVLLGTALIGSAFAGDELRVYLLGVSSTLLALVLEMLQARRRLSVPPPAMEDEEDTDPETPMAKGSQR